ncbi:MAG TPA: hypothetical protein VGY13_06290 [Solirubrobacteraceae bacterium]|nr:hypothetical protein [Solirubrobacteraceae bacterium]
MLNGRLYRAAFLPSLLALAIAAFSLSSGPSPDTTTLAPDAFEGAPAFAELQALASRFPLRRPGSAGDRRLAGYVAQKLEAPAGAGAPGEGRAGGFSVHTYSRAGQTIDGERTLRTVVAQRPGSTGAPPILIVAHRDAAGAGGSSSVAELSATAALLELARVLSARETKRAIVLVSTSGGSGGDAGAAQLVADPAAFGLHGPFDAALVIGDVASARTSPPLVVPYSTGLGSAPLELQRTVAAAIDQEVGVPAGSPSTFGQLAHLAFPLTVGEQGPLNAGGLPAVLVQASGERGPRPGEAVSAGRLEAFGRALLSAVDALDGAPNVPAATQTGLELQRKTMPMWALRLLVGTLLLPLLVAGLDALACARRRRAPIGRWALWTLSCALPFLACAVFAYALGWLGVLGATPPGPALPSALPLDGRALTAIAAVALAFALSWLLRGSLVRRLRWAPGEDAETGSVAIVLVLLALAFLAWLVNPFTALLALPAMHLWLALWWPGRLGLAEPPRRALALGMVAVGLAPAALLVAFYAHQLGLGVGGVAWMGVQLLAGGYVGFWAALLWSGALGCAAAAAILAARRAPRAAAATAAGSVEVSIRGPLSYAGPGSLGGTESALRR